MSTRIRLAALGVGALAFTGQHVTTAAPAGAAPQTATAGSFQWGIRGSLLAYHLNHGGGTQSITSDGAVGATTGQRTSAGKQYPRHWTFPFQSGSYDPATKAFTAQYGGSVLLKDTNPAPTQGPGSSGTSASPFKYLKYANPKVVLTFGATPTGKLFLDVTKGATADTPGPPATVEWANLDLSAGPAAASGSTVSYSGLRTTLTAAAVAALSEPGGQTFVYEGDEYDPTTFSLTSAAPAPSPTPNPTSSPTPTPTPGTTTPKPTPTPTSTPNPDAPGDTQPDPSDSEYEPLPLTGIADESSTPASALRSTPLADGQTVALGVDQVSDTGTGGGLALVGVAALAALVTALITALVLRFRREDGSG